MKNHMVKCLLLLLLSSNIVYAVGMGKHGAGAAGPGVTPGIGAGKPGLGVTPGAGIGKPGLGVTPGLGVGAPGLGAAPGVGVGEPGVGAVNKHFNNVPDEVVVPGNPQEISVPAVQPSEVAVPIEKEQGIQVKEINVLPR